MQNSETVVFSAGSETDSPSLPTHIREPWAPMTLWPVHQMSLLGPLTDWPLHTSNSPQVLQFWRCACALMDIMFYAIDRKDTGESENELFFYIIISLTCELLTIQHYRTFRSIFRAVVPNVFLFLAFYNKLQFVCFQPLITSCIIRYLQFNLRGIPPSWMLSVSML